MFYMKGSLSQKKKRYTFRNEEVADAMAAFVLREMMAELVKFHLLNDCAELELIGVSDYHSRLYRIFVLNFYKV